MIAVLSLAIVLIDQLTKILVLKNSDKLPLDIIKGLFSIALVRNKGAAFGILQNQKLFFIIIAVIAIVAIVWVEVSAMQRNLRKKAPYEIAMLFRISLALILGGAIGNLIDRIRFGYVVDFLDFKVWPVFNIADSAITIGAVLLLIYLFLQKKDKKE
ncbi:MAG: signal peptidase II [Candidatus Omnitrophica bacterium]|nr:signal peptidase II [Candidatus Omnitrophota bacterium]